MWRMTWQAFSVRPWQEEQELGWMGAWGVSVRARDWPAGHVSLGSVLLWVLLAVAVALGTSVRGLTVHRSGGGWGGGDAEARALATRMKSVGHSIDAVAKALSADVPSAAELVVLRRELAAVSAKLKVGTDG